MADIEMTFKLTLNEGVVSMTNAQSSKNQTRESTLDKIHHTIQNVGTSYEDVSTGDVTLTKQHVMCLMNRDATNFVTVAALKDGSNMAEQFIMLPGECCGPFRLALQSAGYPKLQMKADTAACAVEVLVGDAGDPAA